MPETQNLPEPEAECQAEIVRALRTFADGGGRREGTQISMPLKTELSEYQWDRCWWNARWWARNADERTYELFRLAGRGCPVRVEGDHAVIEVEGRFPDRVSSSFGFQGLQVVEGDAEVEAAQSGEGEILDTDEAAVSEDRGVDGALRARAIRFDQNGRIFYTVVLPASKLIERAKVDTWDADSPENEVGYQRAPMASRLRSVANYVERTDAIMPLGGLINARSDKGYGQVLKFEPDKGQFGPIQSGTLIVPDESLPLWIVDMQHRLGGFERAIYDDQRHDLGDFPVVATIADGLSKLEEIEQFEIINTTQKKVRTDLARRLMSVQASSSGEKRLEFEAKGIMWQAKGPIVADWLNRHGSIWRERIQPPNKSKREMPHAIVRETSFVTSMKPVLQQPLFSRMDEEQVAMLIDRYWQALKQTFPEAFETPAEYVIQKTPGVFSLHLLLPEVVELVRSKGQDLTVDGMVVVMKPWLELGSEYWETGYDEGAARYGSMAGFSRLAAELRQYLPKLDLGL